jgi:hypothetical protein
LGEIVLGVNVSQDVLLTWLELHTAGVTAQTFEADGGMLTLEPLTDLRLFAGILNAPIGMHGQFRAASKARPRRVYDVLTLRVASLGWGTELRVDPTWPAVAPYAVSLVGEIARRWPTRILNPSAAAPAAQAENEPSTGSEGENGVASQRPPVLRQDGPRVPTRPKDQVRWQATWQKVKHQWQQGKGYQEMSEWLQRMHPELRCSPETLADLVWAGHAGVLDNQD